MSDNIIGSVSRSLRRSLRFQQLFDNSPSLPSWLTATATAGTVHSAVGFQSAGGYYQMLMQGGATVGTVAKVETTNGLRSISNRIMFEVAGWRFDSDTVGDNDFSIYIKDGTAGFTLAHSASAGKTVCQFVGSAAFDCGWVELMTNMNGVRVKNIGLEIKASTTTAKKTVNVLVDGGVFASFDSPADFGVTNGLKAGFSMTKVAGSTDRWMRYETISLEVDP